MCPKQNTSALLDVRLYGSQLLFVLYTSFLTVSCIHGMGQHAADLPVDRVSRAVFYLLCGQVAVSLVIGLGKVVVAVFLLRIVVEKW